MRVTQLQIFAVTQQKVPILQHPQVRTPVVQRPQPLGFNGSFGQMQHHGTNLSLVALVALARVQLPVNQPRNAKRKQQFALSNKVQRHQAVALSKVERAGRRKAQRLDGNLRRGRQGRIRGISPGKQAFPDWTRPVWSVPCVGLRMSGNERREEQAYERQPTARARK